MEIWKDVVGYEGMYEVSNKGRVRSLDRKDIRGRRVKGKYLKYKKTSRGYLSLQLCGKDCLIHRLVAKAFIPNPENKPQVNHIDGDKSNNNVENLEWCTSSENNKHRYRYGLYNQDGVKNPQSKFTEEDVKEILEMLYKNITLTEIAKQYNVSITTISNIKNGITYKNINLNL